MSDEERGYYEAQDQWSQYHGVTELEEPHAQQAAHLNEVQRSHLEKHTDNVKKKRVSVDLTAWSKSGPMKEDCRLCVWLKSFVFKQNSSMLWILTSLQKKSKNMLIL